MLNTSSEYAMYLRKSRADIELETFDKLDTLKRHETILTELAKRNHYPIGEIYREVVSGETIDARPEMQRLLADIKAGRWKGVLVVEVERLARGDTKDQGIVAEAFKFTNTLIVTPSKTYDPNNQFDEEYFEFGLFMSRREYKTIQRRLNVGKLQSVKEGNYLQSHRPYGWDKVQIGKTRTLAPREEEAKIVKLMYEWTVNEKMTPGAIARRLTDMGVPTYTGIGEWTRSTVLDILRNPVHAGKIRWQYTKMYKEFDEDGNMIKKRHRSDDEEMILVEGKHEGLIPFEFWQQAQKRFKRDKSKANVQLKNPFATVLVCAKCGRPMVYQPHKHRRNTAPRITHPVTRLCTVKSVKYEEIEAAIIYALEAHVEDFATKIDNAAEVAETQRHQQQIAVVEKELENIKAQRGKLFDLLERGLYSEEDFIERKAVLDAKKIAAEKQLKHLQATFPQPTDYKEKAIKLTQAIAALKDDTVSAAAKNKLLKEIVQRIEFSREDNDSFILDVHLL